MPSWQWSHGGRNRAVARAAFADVLPPGILSRTSKAGPDSFIRTAWLVNRPVIAERLLDGELAAQGLLDHRAIERALTGDPMRQLTPVDRLLDLLEAENWARSWT